MCRQSPQSVRAVINPLDISGSLLPDVTISSRASNRQVGRSRLPVVVDVSRTKRHRSRESVNGNLCRRSFRGALAGGRGRYRRGTKVARKRGMFTRHRVVIAAVSASMMIAAATPLRAATIRVYQIEDLGFFPGSNYIAGSALNARGDIAGSFFAADGYMHAFRWTSSNGLEDLGTNGGFSSMAWAMNDNGDVAGVYWDRGWTSHPFVASPGHPMVDLSLRYPDIEWVYAISNDGRLTGFTLTLLARDAIAHTPLRMATCANRSPSATPARQACSVGNSSTGRRDQLRRSRSIRRTNRPTPVVAVRLLVR